LQKVSLSISFSDRFEETSAHVTAICPDHHFLEAWGDAEPVESHFSLAQPLIAPLFDTRAMQASLLAWLGRDSDHHTYLREFWRKKMSPRQHRVEHFDVFWDTSLRDGVQVLPSAPDVEPPQYRGDWKAAARAVLQNYARDRRERSDNFYEL